MDFILQISSTMRTMGVKKSEIVADVIKVSSHGPKRLRSVSVYNRGAYEVDNDNVDAGCKRRWTKFHLHEAASSSYGSRTLT